MKQMFLIYFCKQKEPFHNTNNKLPLFRFRIHSITFLIHALRLLDAALNGIHHPRRSNISDEFSSSLAAFSKLEQVNLAIQNFLIDQKARFLFSFQYLYARKKAMQYSSLFQPLRLLGREPADALNLKKGKPVSNNS